MPSAFDVVATRGVDRRAGGRTGTNAGATPASTRPVSRATVDDGETTGTPERAHRYPFANESAANGKKFDNENRGRELIGAQRTHLDGISFMRTPSTRRGIARGLPSRSAGGSRSSGTDWYVTGRSQRSIAAAPTDVAALDVVEGHGPPCCIDQLTPTPVG